MSWGLEYTLDKMRSHMEAPWRWGKALLASACAATPHAMHHQLSTVRGERLLPMRYYDEADCCGCLGHRTIDYSDCYHELSALRSAMHRTCTHSGPCEGDGCGWGHHVGVYGYHSHMGGVRRCPGA